MSTILTILFLTPIAIAAICLVGLFLNGMEDSR